MKITLGIPFEEYVRQQKIPVHLASYAALENLYDQIQQLQEFISHSYQFRPIGRETARMYFKKLQDLGVEDIEKDRLIDNFTEIQTFVDVQISKAKEKEEKLIAEFEKILGKN